MTYQARAPFPNQPRAPSSPNHQPMHSIHQLRPQTRPSTQPASPVPHHSPTRRGNTQPSALSSFTSQSQVFTPSSQLGPFNAPTFTASAQAFTPQSQYSSPSSLSMSQGIPQSLLNSGSMLGGLSMSQGIPNHPTLSMSGHQSLSLSQGAIPSSYRDSPSMSVLIPPGSPLKPQPKEQEPEGEWTKLDISQKKLVALSPNISIYNHITELYLQDNCLTRLPVELFHSLVHLRHLDLSRNQLNWLQPEICHLLQLRELNLSWNQIRELPMEMGKLFRLEKLSYDGNPLVKPTQDVLAKGTQFIISYFRDRMASGEPPPPRVWATNTKSAEKSNLQSECIRVFCYNVLADAYASPERLNYCPSWALAWDYRKVHLIKEITLYEPDIICLQEVEAEQYSSFFLAEMTGRGYGGEFFAKGRSRTMDSSKSKSVDGCVIFWKHDLFSVVSCERIEYQSLALQKHKIIGPDGVSRLLEKDNVALIMLLKPKGNLKINPKADIDQILIVNTHIHWNPACEDVKVMQVQLLLEQLELMAKTYGSPCGAPLPMIVSGDFNSVTDSAVYTLLDTKTVSSSHPNFGPYDYGQYSKNGCHTTLDLKSSYGQVSGEPSFTNYTGNFVGVLDYIWISDESLSAERVLSPPTEEAIINQNGALPNPYLCSDHIYLVADIYPKIHQKLSSTN